VKNCHSVGKYVKTVTKIYKGFSTSVYIDIIEKWRYEMNRKDLLSQREKEVLELVALGMSNSEIGEKLMVSSYTAQAHVATILRKLHAKRRTQAAIIGVKAGIIQ